MAPPPPTIIFADDLTGALEVGALARRSGRSTTVLLRPKPRNLPCVDHEVVAIDTGTRELDEPRAAEARKAHVAFWRATPAAAVLKKTDSLLRGHVATELNILRKIYPREATVFVPAYPMMGRVVRDGRLYAAVLAGQAPDGIDLIEFLSTSIPRKEIRLVANIDALRSALDRADGSILVCDSERQEEVEAIGELLSPSLDRILVAGPSGVFRGIFRPSEGGAPVPIPAFKSGAALIGSVHAVSNEQVLRLRESPMIAVLPNDACERIDASREAWQRAGADGRWLLVAPFEPGLAEHGNEWLKRIGIPLHALMERPSRFPACLLLSGGETAWFCLGLMGIDALEPQCEILPGIVISTARWRGRTLWIATKSGAFGDPATLEETVRLLRSGHIEGRSIA